MNASAMPATAGILRPLFLVAVEEWLAMGPGDSDEDALGDALMAVAEPVLAEVAALKVCVTHLNAQIAEKDGLLILAREGAFKS